MTLDAAPSPAAAPDPNAVDPAVPLARPWWSRPGLDAVAGRLTIAGRDAETLAREHGTPLFVYDRTRFADNAERVIAALDRSGLRHRVRFALKANPDPEALAVLRPLVGVDACSPGEVLRALDCGWPATDISVTATNLSDRDLDVILVHPVHLNLDAVSQIERLGRRLAARGLPPRSIGLRINPGAGVGYNEKLAYSGERPTKFGIYADRVGDAVAAARRHGLAIDTIHVHAGSGWLADGLPSFEAALERIVGVTRALVADGHRIVELNVGGGLGVPARADEQAIDLDAYAATIARQVGGLDVAIGCEPGDYLAKDTAILLAEVVTVEERAGTRFVGLDVGWNVNCSFFIYGYAQELVVCRAADAPRTEAVTIAGHINEAGDLFAEDYPFPPVVEGDIVALLNAGGYHQAMSSTHCLRPHAEALFLDR
ncbi:MAG: diaminopimelate decarboxylase [Chloroflexota bacterium]|nr:diaminopimelate decarboxylase [Chloroflexota bacterium]